MSSQSHDVYALWSRQPRQAEKLQGSPKQHSKLNCRDQARLMTCAAADLNKRSDRWFCQARTRTFTWCLSLTGPLCTALLGSEIVPEQQQQQHSKELAQLKEQASAGHMVSTGSAKCRRVPWLVWSLLAARWRERCRTGTDKAVHVLLNTAQHHPYMSLTQLVSRLASGPEVQGSSCTVRRLPKLNKTARSGTLVVSVLFFFLDTLLHFLSVGSCSCVLPRLLELIQRQAVFASGRP